jgi:ParB family chromosome partitioning protein
MTAKTYLLETVALSALALAPENERTRDPAKVADLAASIEVLGLINPLSGYRDGDAVMVDAGGYRLEALRQLADEKRLPKAYKGGVPVTVWPSKDLARARSVAENEVREAPHYVDRIRAYGALLDAKKLPPERIAAACGVTRGEVARLLRLKDVAPAILDAAKAGEVAQDVVQAFSIHPDQAVQLAVWEALPSYDRSAWSVKSRLRQDTLPARSGLAQFVGREAYEAAGGRFAVDLFTPNGQEDWLDADLAWRLADEKLAEVVAQVKAEGWGEVIVNPESRDFWRDFDQLDAAEYEFSDEDEADYQAAESTLEDPEASDEDRDAAQAVIDEYERLSDEGSYSADQMASGVAFVFMGTGGPQIERGWKRPAPVTEADEADDGDQGEDGDGDQGEDGDAAPATAQASAPAKAPDDPGLVGFSHDTHHHLTKVGTASVRCALLAKPAAAYDVLLTQLFVAAFSTASDSPVRIRTEGMQPIKETGDERLDVAEASLAVRRGAWRQRFTGAHTFEALLPAVAALKPKEKADLLAVLVASSFDAQQSMNYGVGAPKWRSWIGLGAVAQHIGHAVTDHWSPPAAFLAKASKACLLAGLSAVGVSKFSDKDKRDPMAAALAREGKAKGWLPVMLAALNPPPAPEPASEPSEAAGEASGPDGEGEAPAAPETAPEPALLAAE